MKRLMISALTALGFTTAALAADMAPAMTPASDASTTTAAPAKPVSHKKKVKHTKAAEKKPVEGETTTAPK